MGAYMLRRLLLVVVTLLGIMLVTFAIVRITPGVLGVAGIGEMGGLDAEKVAGIREQQKKLLGLDQPIYLQFPRWVGRSLRLDFGKSRMDNRDVRDLIVERAPITLAINLIVTFIIYVITIPLGVYSATHQRSKLDKLITVGLYALYSLPVVFIGPLLLMLLAKGGKFEIFPVAFAHSVGEERLPFFPWLGDMLWHLVLPIVTLTYGGLAFLTRFQRNNMLEVVRQDYVRTARAKGLTERTVIYKHAMRNALIPLITLMATLLPALIGGSVIVEKIFTIYGMGRLGFEAVLHRDINTVMALTTVSAVLTLIALLITDLIYTVVDPRISLDQRRA
jgi:peptide/nickel transport system permease protein